MEERQVIFVCTGNTCRSPMAEAIFRSEIKRLKIQGVGVLSAGIEAAKKGNINPCSASVLSENGLSLENFSSRLLEKEMLQTAYALICMTDSQRDLLMELRWKLLREAGFAEIENNVYSFSELAGYEIPDPFGRDIDCYRLTYRKLAEGMSFVIQKLFPETEEKRGTEGELIETTAVKAEKKTKSAAATGTKKNAQGAREAEKARSAFGGRKKRFRIGNEEKERKGGRGKKARKRRERTFGKRKSGKKLPAEAENAPRRVTLHSQTLENQDEDML